MSHFYASIRGSRGEATRMGTKNSGILSHIRGWNVGIEVRLEYNHKSDEDECFVYLTGGSNSRSPVKMIGRFTKDDL